MEPAPSTLASRLVTRPDPLGPARGLAAAALAHAVRALDRRRRLSRPALLVVFVVGTFLMRSALRRQKSPPNSFAHHPHEDSQGYRIEYPRSCLLRADELAE
jgi:hypothetical protein